MMCGRAQHSGAVLGRTSPGNWGHGCGLFEDPCANAPGPFLVNANKADFKDNTQKIKAVRYVGFRKSRNQVAEEDSGMARSASSSRASGSGFRRTPRLDAQCYALALTSSVWIWISGNTKFKGAGSPGVA